MRLITILLLTLCSSCVIISQETEPIAQNIFTKCSNATDTNNYLKITSDLFEIEYPSNWKEGNHLKQGLDINSNDFPDSLQRGFMLSIVPYKDVYFKKNPLIDYYRFETGSYNEYSAMYLTRNDLLKIDNENTVYWRNELKIINKRQDLIYILVFGKRYNKDTEPEWCEFEQIINSLKMAE